MAAFEPSSEAVEFEARTEAEFVLGSAVPHKYDLVLGSHSAHTTPAAFAVDVQENVLHKFLRLPVVAERPEAYSQHQTRIAIKKGPERALVPRLNTFHQTFVFRSG